jgi:hypothetical protein
MKGLVLVMISVAVHAWNPFNGLDISPFRPWNDPAKVQQGLFIRRFKRGNRGTQEQSVISVTKDSSQDRMTEYSEKTFQNKVDALDTTHTLKAFMDDVEGDIILYDALDVAADAAQLIHDKWAEVDEMVNKSGKIRRKGMEDILELNSLSRRVFMGIQLVITNVIWDSVDPDDILLYDVKLPSLDEPNLNFALEKLNNATFQLQQFKAKNLSRRFWLL